MEPKIQVLDLFLSELGEQFAIDSLDDRLRLQKAVYLGQLFDVDLGYRYSWYVKGPYSPSLTQDYFKLKEERGSDSTVHALRADVRANLATAKAFLVKPDDIPLAKPQWYELLASIHYLYKFSGKNSESVRATLKATKEHLFDWIDRGEQHLRDHKKL